MTGEPLSVNNNNADNTEGQPNDPDVERFSDSPETTGDEFGLLERAADYLSWDTDKDDRNWEQNFQQKNKKHLQELLDGYQSNLHSVQKRKSMLGPGDSNLTTLENQEKDLERKIHDLENQLYGKYFKDVRESKKFQQRRGSSQVETSPTQEFSNWFKELTPREKLFAITLSIFNGLKYSDFRELFFIVLDVMKVDQSEEEKLARYFEEDDSFCDKVGAEIKFSNDEPEEIIVFKDSSYPARIFGLMRDKYRSLFFELLPVLREIVERHRYWEIRSRAALALAEIGKIAFRRVRTQVIDHWASNDRAYVRAAVGYPLARLAEDSTTRLAVEHLLGEWCRFRVQGNSWRYHWTAASVYKQIGFIEADWVEDWIFNGLKKLAGIDDIRIADSVIHTLVVLSLQRPLANILVVLKEWIEEGIAGNKDNTEPQTRCIVAILAFMVISEIHIEVSKEEDNETEPDEALGRAENLFNLVQQSEREKGDLWQLMVAVGVRSFEYRGLADEFFNLIVRWTEHCADEPQLQNTVRNLLAEVFLIVRPRYRERILNRLNRWERQNKKEHLSQMAKSTKLVIKDRVLNEPLLGSPDDQIIFG